MNFFIATFLFAYRKPKPPFWKESHSLWVVGLITYVYSLPWQGQVRTLVTKINN